MRQFDFRMTFPRVLPKMAHDDSIDTLTTFPLTIADASATLRGYFGALPAALRFEREVASPMNRRKLNVVTEHNVLNANRLKAGLTKADLGPWLERSVPGLDQIPQDADLFAGEQHDAAAVEAMTALHGPQRSLSKVMKLLYQKRPGFFPVLDDYVRRALNMGWTRETGQGGNLLILRRFREAAMGNPHTAQTLADLVDWVNANRTAVHGLQLSRVRIFDIIAWSAIARRRS